jgi:hypothetical protein
MIRIYLECIAFAIHSVFCFLNRGRFAQDYSNGYGHLVGTRTSYFGNIYDIVSMLSGR